MNSSKKTKIKPERLLTKVGSVILTLWKIKSSNTNKIGRRINKRI
jgi:hypothetical protein